MGMVIEVPVPRTIKGNVTYQGRTTEKTYTFETVMIGVMADYEPAGKGIENIERAISIRRTMRESLKRDQETAKESLTVVLDVEEHKMLSNAIATYSWIPEAAELMLPFFKAVSSAKKV